MGRRDEPGSFQRTKKRSTVVVSDPVLCDAGRMALRQTNIGRMRDGLFDVLVVGAGINGAVSAAALAGRGASVALIDRGDFGSFTSQESSNLVWGGFKYLENYELPLVFGLCRSRNRLMKAYPDNIKEIGFLAALDRSAPYRPWFAALGATAYWAIGLFGTKPPKVFDADEIKAEEPAIETGTVRGGIQYQDAYLIDNDSRFVFSFVRSAIDAGAAVANYVELVSAERVAANDGHRWVARLRDVDSGRGVHDVGANDRQCGRAVRRRAERELGQPDRPPHRVLEGHPPRRAAVDDHETRSRARVLRRHPVGCST